MSSHRQATIQRAASHRSRQHEREQKPALDAHKAALRDRYAGAADAETARREVAAKTAARTQVRSHIQAALRDPGLWRQRRPLWKEWKWWYMRKERQKFEEKRKENRKDLVEKIQRWDRTWPHCEFPARPPLLTASPRARPDHC